jgi:hypothetical protein
VQYVCMAACYVWYIKHDEPAPGQRHCAIVVVLSMMGSFGPMISSFFIKLSIVVFSWATRLQPCSVPTP